MPIHHFVSQLLRDTVLPYAIHVHGLDIPYRAEPRIGDEAKHRDGVVSLHIGENGYLTAEYVGYDADVLFDLMGTSVLGKSVCKVVILDTQVELPVQPISTSRTKARMLYEGRVTGWLGQANTEIQSVMMLMTDFPDVRMPSLTNTLADRPIDRFLSLRGTETARAVLTLTAGEWTVELQQPGSGGVDRSDALSAARVTRKDGTAFVLDDSPGGILTALRTFLSFQSGSWINTALISGHHRKGPSGKTDTAYVGRLSKSAYTGNSVWTASDYDTWPSMFARFWTLFNRAGSVGRLMNAITHYVSSSAVFANPQSATYGIVPARSTLEALVKWWNNLPYDFEFGGGESDNFVDLLVKAVHHAELGRDSGCMIDDKELKAVVDRGTEFRNTIDHGSAGVIPDGELERVIAHQLYLQNLARLLISAKLGLRDRHTRGSFYSPKFVEV